MITRLRENQERAFTLVCSAAEGETLLAASSSTSVQANDH